LYCLSVYQHKHRALERRHEDELADLAQRHRGSPGRMDTTFTRCFYPGRRNLYLIAPIYASPAASP
jgi:hypothetical protein